MLMHRNPLAGLLLTAAAAAVSPVAASAAPPDDDHPRAAIEAVVDGRTLSLPLLHTDIDTQVAGDLATVTVRQTFANPAGQAQHARYLFPLADDAAVYRMVLKSGSEIIEAQIQRRDQARAIYEQAKTEGRNAALLEQHRPNLFTQEIANLMPGAPVEVTLAYVQTVPRIDGSYELVIPLVAGPRYQPTPAQVAAAAAAATPAAAIDAPARSPEPGLWRFDPLPAAAPVAGLTVPDLLDADRVGLTVTIDGGMPIAGADSPSHAVTRTEDSPQLWRLALAGGRTLDNRDFVLRYRLGGTPSAAAGLIAQRDRRGGFFSLLLEPPAMPPAADITPREMVFVLDCSGSMAGAPLDAVKLFMRKSLAGLRPGDSFRIIRFSDGATEFSNQPLPATGANLAAGLAYLDSLNAEGGTNMSTGIVQALATPPADGTLRLVTFLTDGYIGNEDDVLRLIGRHLGAARLYAFGVGTAVNRYLLQEMGRVGRGFTRILAPGEEAAAVAAELAGRLETPILTDLAIDWGTLAPTELTEDRLPDLFADRSLRIQGRYATPGRHEIRITGMVNGRRAELPLVLDLPEAGGAGDAVALVWARTAIEHEMRRLLTPSQPPVVEVENRVTALGLTFNLVTRWTSFVAQSNRIVNTDPAAATTQSVPVPMVAGVGPGAYPPKQAPEGGMLGGMAVVLLGLSWALRRRRPRGLGITPQ